MASFRRSMSLAQRDGAVQNGEATSDTSPSPKLAHPRIYLALGRFLNRLFTSLDFLVLLDRVRAAVPSVFLQRSSRPSERSKVKGQLWKRAFFHFFVFFFIGIFIGFTPFLSVDISSNLVSKHHAFSFEENPVARNALNNIGMVKDRVSLLEKPASKDDVSLVRVAKWEMKNESVGTSYAPSPVQDLGLVYRKLLIIVTPTYARPFQAYYLNRLAYTLRSVPPPLLWMVVEASLQSSETAKILRETGIIYRHLVCQQNITSIKHRDVHQRNAALSHIEKHRLDGIVFFADDDRMYSIDLFDQMRQIRRFGTWPVATLTESKNKVILEGPICNGSQVIGWHTDERRKISHRFHADMSGFAFNSTILWDPKRWHRPTLESIRQLDSVKDGFQETTFIEQLVEDESQMEGLPKDCSRIMVWHLQLEAPELFYPESWLMQKNLEVVAPLT